MYLGYERKYKNSYTEKTLKDKYCMYYFNVGPVCLTGSSTVCCLLVKRLANIWFY